MTTKRPLFERIRWRDPVTGETLEPIVSARVPGGGPLCGALRRCGTRIGYPIVDSVVRLTPQLATQHRDWLASLDLVPPESEDATRLQTVDTVESFGWQWTWSANMRSRADLEWRVARRFGLEPSAFDGRFALDAGAGAGDQSRFLLDEGASVVSIDLSEAIDIVASKLRMNPRWVGVQGDITALPFGDEQFDVVYCEGVIQHTRDSQMAVRELARVVIRGGQVLATHYNRTTPTSAVRRAWRRITLAYYESLRSRLSRMQRFPLLLVTGNLAALSYLPVVGRLLRWSGTALYYDLQPDFKTTWTNTFDMYGNHAFQRVISPAEFAGYFDAIPGMTTDVRGAGLVLARKTNGRPIDSSATAHSAGGMEAARVAD